MRSYYVRLALCLAVLAWALPGRAWTDKPVHVIVPAPAGGLFDTMARLLSEQLAADLGQPVMVENKPGAGGFIGIKAMLTAPPDGQTIMVTASNVLTEIPLVMKTGFDPLKDVKPVASVGVSRLVLVASADLPAKDFKSLVAYLKTGIDKQTYASYSTGTASHYGGLMLNDRLRLDMKHVPFPGAPPALVQVMGRQISVMFDNIPHSLPFIQSGKLQPYAVAAKVRSPVLPQVPTFAELGYPEIDFANWVGVSVSAQVSPETAEKIRAAVMKAAAAPKVRDRLVAIGYEPSLPQSTDELGEATRAEHARNAGLVKTYGIRNE